MSPYSLRMLAVDPLVMLGGMMPVAKPPSGTIVVVAAWLLVKHAMNWVADEIEVIATVS